MQLTSFFEPLLSFFLSFISIIFCIADSRWQFQSPSRKYPGDGSPGLTLHNPQESHSTQKNTEVVIYSITQTEQIYVSSIYPSFLSVPLLIVLPLSRLISLMQLYSIGAFLPHEVGDIMIMTIDFGKWEVRVTHSQPNPNPNPPLTIAIAPELRRYGSSTSSLLASFPPSLLPFIHPSYHSNCFISSFSFSFSFSFSYCISSTALFRIG